MVRKTASLLGQILLRCPCVLLVGCCEILAQVSVLAYFFSVGFSTLCFSGDFQVAGAVLHLIVPAHTSALFIQYIALCFSVHDEVVGMFRSGLFLALLGKPCNVSMVASSSLFLVSAGFHCSSTLPDCLLAVSCFPSACSVCRFGECLHPLSCVLLSVLSFADGRTIQSKQVHLSRSFRVNNMSWSEFL